MRRKDREMPESFALSLIDQTDFATLSLIDPDGEPYGVAIQIIRDEKTLYFHSANAGFKLDCLRKNPKICLTCVKNVRLIPEELTTKYQSAVIRGTAEEVYDSQEKVQALTLLGARFAPEHLHLLEGEISAHLKATSIWKINVSSITGKEHK